MVWQFEAATEFRSAGPLPALLSENALEVPGESLELS